LRIDLQEDRMGLENGEGNLRLVVSIKEIDHATAAAFRAELAEALGRYEAVPPPGSSHGAPLVVDLSLVTFLDSSGIQALVEVDREAARRGGRLVLSGADGVVRRCLEVTGVYERLAIPDGSPA
jgi:stage II sporulation protein AA (anti-sigma F factor antagonist)